MDDYLDKYLELQETKKDENQGETTVKPLIVREPEPKVYNSINFIWLDGRQQAFSYSYMTSVEFKALQTGNRITATFTTHKVTISGFSLSELYDDLVNRYVNTVEQADENLAFMVQDDIPMITQIEVQPYH